MVKKSKSAAKSSGPAINIGISEKDRTAIALGDEPTADLLTQRLTVHEQTASMLRSLLED